MNLTQSSSMETIIVDEVNGDLCIPENKVEADELYQATIYANTSSVINRHRHMLLFTQGFDISFGIKFVLILPMHLKQASLNCYTCFLLLV